MNMPDEPNHPLGESSAAMRRRAADTLHHLARQIELGKIEVQSLDATHPLVRVPGANMAVVEFEAGVPFTFTLHYTLNTGGGK
jgi:hypothetical protein